MSGSQRARDALNPGLMFQETDTALLLAAVHGKIDLPFLARYELAQRGIDDDGEYIGHAEAARSLGVEHFVPPPDFRL